MAVIKKTVSLPEEVYKEVEKLSENFSETVREALHYYIKKKKIEKTLSTAGSFKDFNQSGNEFVDEIRKKDTIIEEERFGA